MLTHTDPCLRLSSRVLARQYYLQGNSCIMATLFRRHRRRIYQLCLAYLKQPNEAEDATMEIFEYLSRHLRQYQIQHFTSWLMIFSRNHCIRRMEQLNRRKKLSAALQQLNWYDHQPECSLTKENRLTKLHSGISQLKNQQRNCLLRFYFEQQSYKEIALELELSPKEVKSHIQNGKRNLRKLLLDGGW